MKRIATRKLSSNKFSLSHIFPIIATMRDKYANKISHTQFFNYLCNNTHFFINSVFVKYLVRNLYLEACCKKWRERSLEIAKNFARKRRWTPSLASLCIRPLAFRTLAVMLLGYSGTLSKFTQSSSSSASSSRTLVLEGIKCARVETIDSRSATSSISTPLAPDVILTLP